VKRLIVLIASLALIVTSLACAKSSPATPTPSSSSSTVSYNVATGQWTLPSGWKATENPKGSGNWDIANTKGVRVARYQVESNGSTTLTEIPGISFDQARNEWTLPNGWIAGNINNKVWNVYDQNNHRVAQYEIQVDGSLQITESDYNPASYL